MVKEKQAPEGGRKGAKYIYLIISIVLSVYLWFFAFRPDSVEQSVFGKVKVACHGMMGVERLKKDVCVNVDKISSGRDEKLKYILGEDYGKISLEKMQGAIQIATVSTEDMGPVGEDKAWETLGKFHEFLQKAFPLVHKRLKKELVNKYGLLYTWEGSDKSLKPIILMAHQDVVPVVSETIDQWKHEPYSGLFDGSTIWGRGSVDDKHPLIAILEAAELRLEEGFQPARTVLFSFGYDEESGGVHGAGTLSQEIERRYGKDSIEAIVDEGGMGVGRFQGTNLATVGVSEKGRMVGQIDLYTKGGHASMPPDHTGIGIASKLVALIEDTPHKARLSPQNPFLTSLQCMAVHSDTMSKLQRAALLKAGYDSAITEQVIASLSKNPLLKNNMMTSQAIDIFNGGVKVNALPEKVNIQIDHRIAVEQTVTEIEKKLLNNILEIAKAYGLGVRTNGKTLLEGTDDEQYFEYTTSRDHWNPAPVSPTNSAAWKQFAGTIRHVYEDYGGRVYDIFSGESVEPDNIVVTPSLMNGNTDTRYYWNLTNNIFRFTPLRFHDDPNIHTVNEHINLDAHLEGVALFYEYFETM
ncbi:hypothetical protein TRICI_000072 [Trichomonascus ciferrii]|uniref:Peptidase M20 dimerisation domain-containing protein n=1 Tax=Trichomonascus ciferrii TaxID=44093 RepID=A0A642VEF4_9ASCO|nr:hypothetical protein TRICI_000072 [Trichomonascus ciferrii]